MAAVYERFESADVSKGKAVVSATPNEQHETGARMVADLLELDGWQVTYLGANTPGGDILDCAVASEAALVALSASMPFNIDKVAELAAEVRNRKTTSPLKIMVGGIAFLGIPRLWESVGADGYAPDAISAVSLANQWWKDLTHA